MTGNEHKFDGAVLNKDKVRMPGTVPYAAAEPGRPCVVAMGGSFNPPTIAHLRLMLAAVEAVGAQKGIFVPSNDAYVRKKMKRQHLERETIPEQLRLEMLEVMCGEDSRLTAEPCEYGRDERAKTYETMETIQEKYPHALIYFVAGGDKLKVMSRWHRKEEFLENFRILVVKREDSSPEAIIDKISFLNQHRDAFALLKEPVGLEGISSSKVRDLLRRGDENGKTLVHPGVWKLLLEDGRLETGITGFRGDYHFLSNFYESPLEYEGLRYQNAEAAFQAQKCTDDGEKAEFCSLAANKAKRLGRQVKLREDWEEVKTGLMLQIVRAKFAQNPELADELLRTGDRKLIEGNTWHDVFWGMDLNTGQGENHLGRILMQVREEMREEKAGEKRQEK